MSENNSKTENYTALESYDVLRLPDRFPAELRKKWNSIIDEMDAVTEMDSEDYPNLEEMIERRAEIWEEELNEMARMIDFEELAITVDEDNIFVDFKENIEE